jgi:predicted kinase
MRKLTILRGLPGSGKTTLAKKMEKEGAVVLSTDDFLTEQGVFRWSEDGSLEAHHKNQQALSAAMREEKPNLVVDATNMQPHIAAPYVRLAKFYDYDWTVKEPRTPWAADIDELTVKNQHNVPRSVIEIMHRTYVSIPTESMIVALLFENKMDPVVTLREAQRSLEVTDNFTANEKIIEYRDWRTLGGYEPIGGDDTADNIFEKLHIWRRNSGFVGV